MKRIFIQIYMQQLQHQSQGRQKCFLNPVLFGYHMLKKLSNEILFAFTPFNVLCLFNHFPSKAPPPHLVLSLFVHMFLTKCRSYKERLFTLLSSLFILCIPCQQALRRDRHADVLEVPLSPPGCDLSLCLWHSCPSSKREQHAGDLL